MKYDLLATIRAWDHTTFPYRQESINTLRYDWTQYIFFFELHL